MLVKEESTYDPVLLVYTLGASSATLNATVTLPVTCSSMDIANDKIVIGAPAWENASSEVRGRVYVYSTDTTPSLLYTIDNPQDVDNNFGFSVTLNNNYYFASAHESNRVYMFNTDGTYHATINNPNLYDSDSDSTSYTVYDDYPTNFILDGHNDNFGLKISVSGDILCIAAPTEENYNDSINNGIVYFYDLSAQNLVYSGYREAGSIDSSYTNETLGLGDILVKGTDIFVNNGSDFTAGKNGTKLYHLTYTG